MMGCQSQVLGAFLELEQVVTCEKWSWVLSLASKDAQSLDCISTLELEVIGKSKASWVAGTSAASGDSQVGSPLPLSRAVAPGEA
mmetsp:Transcript_42522/g.101711  ORF Transcript_42522/g.101711 Transcript_42522/m.101711 type:complete len:85 (+) Transcript_42522:439-693(+)